MHFKLDVLEETSGRFSAFFWNCKNIVSHIWELKKVYLFIAQLMQVLLFVGSLNLKA